MTEIRQLRLLFDIETDGLLEEMTRINCLVIKNVDTGEIWRFRNVYEGESDIHNGVALLEEADVLVGHNIICFDIPAIQKIYPYFKPKAEIFDTLVASRLIWTDLKGHDMANVRRGKYDRKLIEKYFGKHSLEAWGYRLHNLKSQWEHTPGQKWSQEMEDYCVQDVEVTNDLFKLIASKNYSGEALQLEMDVQKILWRQECRGVGFNEKKAGALYATLVEHKFRLEKQLKTIFEPFYLADGKVFFPKADNKRWGYRAGCAVQKIKLHEFNPGSRDHIADRLMKKRGWQPVERTFDGKPKVDETVLADLPYPEAKILSEYLMVCKRIGQVAEGKEAWLKCVKKGRIHGRVNTNGARTGRMTHFNPNLAQVPKAKTSVPYGEECRDCFEAAPGKVLVGVDAASLELRGLAHYMGRFDGGEYTKVVLEGDPHTTNQKAADLDSRDKAKRWFYALIYGAGNGKLGSISNGVDGRDGKIDAREGKAKRTAFMANLPAFGKLVRAVQEAAQNRGYLIGLDGRHLICPSQHSALNTLLQSAGAVVMKKAQVLLDMKLIAAGFKGKYEFVLTIHDEWAIEAHPKIAEQIGILAVDAIKLAGEHFKFRCPLDGEMRIGHTWKDIH